MKCFDSLKVHWCRFEDLQKTLSRHSEVFNKKVWYSINEMLWFIKGTLMQIWKFAKNFVFIWKQYVEDFTLKHLLLFEICACAHFWNLQTSWANNWKYLRLKGEATDKRYFARRKVFRSLVHKKNLSLIWKVVFNLGDILSREEGYLFWV